MKDMTIKGTGNSRFLKSVSNFLTLYPDYESFVAALVAGTLPVDFNGLNNAGIQQAGTPLSKANLLTDATAQAIYLSQGDPTVNDALAKIQSGVYGKEDDLFLETTTGILTSANAGVWFRPVGVGGDRILPLSDPNDLPDGIEFHLVTGHIDTYNFLVRPAGHYMVVNGVGSAYGDYKVTGVAHLKKLDSTWYLYGDVEAAT